MKNQFNLVGNIGQKPELKKSAKGTSYLQFSLAVSDDYKAKDATEWTKRPAIWFNLVVFGDKAESLAKILDKGSKVSVSGKLQMKTIEDSKKYSVPDLVVFQVDLISSSAKADSSNSDDDVSDY